MSHDHLRSSGAVSELEVDAPLHTAGLGQQPPEQTGKDGQFLVQHYQGMIGGVEEIEAAEDADDDEGANSHAAFGSEFSDLSSSMANNNHAIIKEAAVAAPLWSPLNEQASTAAGAPAETSFLPIIPQCTLETSHSPSAAEADFSSPEPPAKTPASSTGPDSLSSAAEQPTAAEGAVAEPPSETPPLAAEASLTPQQPPQFSETSPVKAPQAGEDKSPTLSLAAETVPQPSSGIDLPSEYEGGKATIKPDVLAKEAAGTVPAPPSVNSVTPTDHLWSPLNQPASEMVHSPSAADENSSSPEPPTKTPASLTGSGPLSAAAEQPTAAEGAVAEPPSETPPLAAEASLTPQQPPQFSGTSPVETQQAGEDKSPTLSPAAETVPQPFSGTGLFESAEGVRVQAARFGKKFIAAARHTAAHTWKAGLFVLLVSFVLIQSKFVRSSFQELEGLLHQSEWDFSAATAAAAAESASSNWQFLQVLEEELGRHCALDPLAAYHSSNTCTTLLPLLHGTVQMAAWLERESLVLAGQEVVASVAEKALARTLQAALNSGKDWPLFVPVDTTFQASIIQELRGLIQSMCHLCEQAHNQARSAAGLAQLLLLAEVLMAQKFAAPLHSIYPASSSPLTASINNSSQAATLLRKEETKLIANLRTCRKTILNLDVLSLRIIIQRLLSSPADTEISLPSRWPVWNNTLLDASADRTGMT